MNNVISNMVLARQRLLEANQRLEEAGRSFDLLINEQKEAARQYNDALETFDKNYKVE